MNLHKYVATLHPPYTRRNNYKDVTFVILLRADIGSNTLEHQRLVAAGENILVPVAITPPPALSVKNDCKIKR